MLMKTHKTEIPITAYQWGGDKENELSEAEEEEEEE